MTGWESDEDQSVANTRRNAFVQRSKQLFLFVVVGMAVTALVRLACFEWSVLMPKRPRSWSGRLGLKTISAFESTHCFVIELPPNSRLCDMSVEVRRALRGASSRGTKDTNPRE